MGHYLVGSRPVTSCKAVRIEAGVEMLCGEAFRVSVLQGLGSGIHFAMLPYIDELYFTEERHAGGKYVRQRHWSGSGGLSPEPFLKPVLTASLLFLLSHLGVSQMRTSVSLDCWAPMFFQFHAL